jgi:putative FmdB family regulatory protein
MPLFEYECRGCGNRFEHLTRASDDPTCPACKGADLQKMFSVFAAQSSTPAKSWSHPSAKGPIGPETTACGHCGDPRGPGACSIN